ncbi:MAG: hypothetical protein Q7J10_01255, partial [Methanosarcinaceae archaeon]|nr:hypothetical protein [Methanosarcinaceae archaeon]
MESIGKFKIIKHRPKGNIVYPLIRLPQAYAHLAGETAHVFKVDNNGEPLFVISLNKDFDGNIVVQPNEESDLKTRVESLEKQLNLLLKTPSEEEKVFNGPAEIRTQ